MNPNETVALVLSGGGARAAYEVGVLKALYSGKSPAARDQNPPEVFCGTGAGAFNAAVIASRLPGQSPSPVGYLESLWADEIPREGLSRHNRVYRKRLNTIQFLDIPYMWRRPFQPIPDYLRDIGYLAPRLASRIGQTLVGNFSGWLDLSIWHDSMPMQRLIAESVSVEIIRDGEKAARPRRVLRVVATERGSGEPVIFRNEDFTDEDGHSIIRASCAVPVFFPPVTVAGREYLYGGLVMQAPLAPAAAAGATVIHLIHNEPRVERRLESGASSIREMLNRTVAVALAATMERDLESRRTINRALASFQKVKDKTGVRVEDFLENDGRFRHIVVHQHRPKEVLGAAQGFLDFSRGLVEKAIVAGERDALAHDCAESGCIL